MEDTSFERPLNVVRSASNAADATVTVFMYRQYNTQARLVPAANSSRFRRRRRVVRRFDAVESVPIAEVPESIGALSPIMRRSRFMTVG